MRMRRTAKIEEKGKERRNKGWVRGSRRRMKVIDSRRRRWGATAGTRGEGTVGKVMGRRGSKGRSRLRGVGGE